MSDWADNKALERISVEKWELWFTRGKWKHQDYTKADSANFVVPDYVSEYCLPDKKAQAAQVLYDLLAYLRMPFDGIAVRGKFAFCFDYKYKVSTCYGIAIPMDDYDKYWGWRLPLLYLLIYASDTEKLWMHQVQDPSKFSEAEYASEPSYEIKPFCYEPINPAQQLDIEILPSYEDAIAQLIRFEKMAKSWRWKQVKPDDTDYQAAQEKIKCKMPYMTKIVARKPDYTAIFAKKSKRPRKSKSKGH